MFDRFSKNQNEICKDSIFCFLTGIQKGDEGCCVKWCTLNLDILRPFDEKSPSYKILFKIPNLTSKFILSELWTDKLSNKLPTETFWLSVNGVEDLVMMNWWKSQVHWRPIMPLKVAQKKPINEPNAIPAPEQVYGDKDSIDMVKRDHCQQTKIPNGGTCISPSATHASAVGRHQKQKHPQREARGTNFSCSVRTTQNDTTVAGRLTNESVGGELSNGNQQQRVLKSSTDTQPNLINKERNNRSSTIIN